MQDDFQNTNFTMENLANAFEAILIEGLEPRQNRKAGNDFGFEFIQAQDPELEEDKATFVLVRNLMKKEPPASNNPTCIYLPGIHL